MLVKRVNALVRRDRKEENADEGLKINREAYTATLGKTQLELTVKEFEILCYLYDNKGRVFSRDQILSAVWGYDFEGESRTVDIHIQQLRKKLGLHKHLVTIPKLGYRLNRYEEL